MQVKRGPVSRVGEKPQPGFSIVPFLGTPLGEAFEGIVRIPGADR
jgi:hypothetical protein